MKKLTCLVAAVFMVTFVFAQETQQEVQTDTTKGPKISFKEDMHDFGDITQGDKVNHVFTFENNGTEPLILSNVNTTCGCTATNWPRDPIAPGDTATIKVSFNSAGKMGRQNKIVTIVSNAVNGQERIKVVSNVLPKKDES